MMAWFARVGLPLTPAERRSLDAWMRGAATRTEATAKAVASWPEAMRLVRAMEVDSAWWDQEEAEREHLWLRAANVEGEAALLRHLTAVADAIAGDLHAQAVAATARAGIVDSEVRQEAVGAALLAAHHNALRERAGVGGSHGFAHKYALFSGGRWPLGYHFGQFLIF